jgi:serine/threonine protein kinase
MIGAIESANVPATRQGLPAQIGPYRLLETLGQGGVGLVLKVQHVGTGELAALKTVKMAREAQLASVRRELVALKRIRHRGIVKVLDGGIYEGGPWYAMELLQGLTLSALVSGGRGEMDATTVTRTSASHSPHDFETGDPPSRPALAFNAVPGTARPPACGGRLPQFLTLIRRLCEPLAYLHGEGIVHRDLKPSNIFVCDDGTPVLMDFGLAWILHTEESRELLSVDAIRGGTVPYMAPEQARGERLDARADLFALGAVMYQVITGQPAFHIRSQREMGVLERHEAPPPPSRLVEGVPAALDALVLQLLAPRASDRLGHASDVAAVLAGLGAEPSPGGGDPPARAYLYRPAIAGRGPAIEEARRWLDRLGQGTGAGLLVEGESGIGKTSLVAEVARMAAAKAIRVITGECSTVGGAGEGAAARSTPFQAFAHALQQIADVCTAGGPELAERLLGARAKVLAICEPSLGQIPGLAHHPDPPALPGEAAQRRLVEALADTLAAFARERPLLLVVDDLQWADEMTFAFLRSLSPAYFECVPLLLLGTFRSEEKGPELQRLEGSSAFASISLDRLDASAIAAMTADMLGVQQASPRLTAFLAAESSGNPFFVAEYLRAAVDGGLLFRDDQGKWRQPDDSADWVRLGLPRTLHELVTRRMVALPPDSRRIAEIAAVLGREVDIEILAAMAAEVGVAADELTFADRVLDLTSRQVLERAQPGRLRFVHDKLRESEYAQLGSDRRVALHARAGRLLERHYQAEGAIERVLGDLAHHFEQGGEPIKALEYLDRAARAAHRTHSNRESTQLFTRARAIAEKHGIHESPLQRTRRERLLGLNALELGDIQGALAHLLAATRLSGKPWPESRRLLVGQCLASVGRELARRRLPWLIRDPKVQGDDRELLLEAARAYERLVVVFFFATGDFPSVALAALANLDLAEQAGGESPELALGYATLSSMASLVPIGPLARFYGDRALGAARQAADPVAESLVLINVTMTYLQSSRWSRVREFSERARALARELGFTRRWEEASSQFSTACFLSGRFAEARQLNDDISRSTERADPQAQVWAVIRRAELCLVDGDTTGALAAAREGRALCEKNLGRPEWIYALGALALASVRAAQLAEARNAADACLDWIAKGAPIANYNIFSYAAVAETYFALLAGATNEGERRTLRVLAARAVKQVRAIARVMPAAGPRAALWGGMKALHLQHQPAAAAKLFRQSRSLAQGLNMPYDEAVALLALAELEPGSESAQRDLADAIRILDRLGALHDLERARRLQSAARS